MHAQHMPARQGDQYNGHGYSRLVHSTGDHQQAHPGPPRHTHEHTDTLGTHRHTQAPKPQAGNAHQSSLPWTMGTASPKGNALSVAQSNTPMARPSATRQLPARGVSSEVSCAMGSTTRTRTPDCAGHLSNMTMWTSAQPICTASPGHTAPDPERLTAVPPVAGGTQRMQTANMPKPRPHHRSHT